MSFFHFNRVFNRTVEKALKAPEPHTLSDIYEAYNALMKASVEKKRGLTPAARKYLVLVTLCDQFVPGEKANIFTRGVIKDVEDGMGRLKYLLDRRRELYDLYDVQIDVGNSDAENAIGEEIDRVEQELIDVSPEFVLK